MVNTNIQASISLSGAGLRNRDRFIGYVPGEFTECANLLSNGKGLETRHGVKPWPSEGLVTSYYTDEVRIISNGPDIVVASKGTNFHQFQGEGFATNLWNNSLISGTLVGYFKYNDIYYWIEEVVDSVPSDHYEYNLYYSSNILSAFGALTTANILSLGFTTGDRLIQFEIIKERLFLLTGNRVYFSAPTDPTNFVAPDGGFIDLPDVTFNSMAFKEDTVYFGHSMGMHVLTFNTDPAVDGVLRFIFNTEPVESVILHKDSIYFLTYRGFYAGSNSNSELIIKQDEVDSNVTAGYNRYTHLASTSLGIIFYVGSPYKSQFGSPSSNYRCLLWQEEYNFFTHFFVNDYESTTLNTESGDYGLFNIVVKDEFIIFHYAKSDFDSIFYFMDTVNLTHFDKILKSEEFTSFESYPIPVDLEINSFVPDGSEHLMKKYRSILIEADVPPSGFFVSTMPDNISFSGGTARSITKNVSPEVGVEFRSPYPFRIPINKRGRSLTIRFYRGSLGTIVTGNEKSVLISDLRVLWMYTQRAVDDN